MLVSVWDRELMGNSTNQRAVERSKRMKEKKYIIYMCSNINQRLRQNND